MGESELSEVLVSEVGDIAMLTGLEEGFANQQCIRIPCGASKP